MSRWDIFSPDEQPSINEVSIVFASNRSRRTRLLSVLHLSNIIYDVHRDLRGAKNSPGDWFQPTARGVQAQEHNDIRN